MDSLLFIIILYNRTIPESSAYLSFKEQLDGTNVLNKYVFFFYDNSPVRYEGVIPQNCVYVHDANNGGVSKGYNVGAEYAKLNNFKWLLLLDQDTTFPKSYLEHLGRAMANNENINIFVPRIFVEQMNKYISPGLVRIHRTIPHKIKYAGVKATSDMNIINSGLCIVTDVFFQVGKYDENVYLDFSDTCFWQKVQRWIADFYVLDIDVYQDFSALEKDVNKAVKRFKHYCICAKKYPKFSIYDKFTFFILMIGKTIKMSLRYRSLVFFKIMVNKYVIG